MKMEITINDLNELLEKALGFDSVTIDEGTIFTWQLAGAVKNRQKIRFNLGDMLNLKINVEND